jgi:CheY-like chemotaxis protein
MRILVVEDQDAKFVDLCAAIGSDNQTHELMRAPSMNVAEEYLSGSKFDLLILDISLNISQAVQGSARGGHANLGGLQIVERLWLLSIEVPTVVVTGFDAFEGRSGRSTHLEVLSLNEVESRAREFLQENLLGCIRYGSVDWQERLRACIRGRQGRCAS